LTKQIAFVMDPIESINPKKDTTLALIVSAKDAGWDVYYVEPQFLTLKSNKLYSKAQKIKTAALSLTDFVSLEEAQDVCLSDFSCIFMRKDPPFDIAYIYSTYLLEIAERHGVLVVNKPGSIRDCNEKLFATQFSEHTPELVVSADMDQLRLFVRQQENAILKPLDGMGGASIFKTSHSDPNLSVILETLTEHGKNVIMGQAFIPDISEGDKRILMVNGEPVPYCLARIPKKGETRGNLAAGGTGRVQELSAADKEIAAAVGPVLKDKAILFAGLDVIGNKLTEINVTSPTCLREISNHSGIDVASQVITVIEERIGV